jgi:hypothetical protein
MSEESFITDIKPRDKQMSVRPEDRFYNTPNGKGPRNAEVLKEIDKKRDPAVPR